MSEPTMDELVRAGSAALRAGERDRARRILSQAVRANPRSEQAWLLLAGAVSDPEQRRSCLERVLRLNPEHAIARKALGAMQASDAGRPPASPQPAERQERTQPLQAAPAREPAQTRQLAPTIAPLSAVTSAPAQQAAPAAAPLRAHAAVADEQRAVAVERRAQAAPAQPGSFDSILAQLRTPAAVGETTVVPPGLAAIAPAPLPAVGTETTQLVPKPAPQFTLPMELAADDARRRREARQLWLAVLIVGIVLLLIGLALAAAVVLAG